MIGKPICISASYDLGKEEKRRIFQPVYVDNGLEGTFPSVMPKFDSRRVKGNRTGLLHHLPDTSSRNEEKLSLAIHESLDEPRAGDPVYMHV